MPLFGKRNLVMLLVIKIFVIGLFLSGCQEGTNKSPISALYTSDDLYGKGGSEEVIFNNSSITGKIINSVSGTGSASQYIGLYEWTLSTYIDEKGDKTAKSDYEVGNLIASATTGEDGKFTISSIKAGKYCIYVGKNSSTPKWDYVTRDGKGEVAWKVFEKNTVIAANYIHSIENIDVESNKELSIFTSY